MVLSFKLPVTIFMNHSVNSAIAQQTKLVTTDTTKQNLQFIKASMYLSEFNLQVLHHPEKSHTVSDALSQLSSRNIMNTSKNTLNIKTFHMFIRSTITMSENFHKQLQKVYKKNKT